MAEGRKAGRASPKNRFHPLSSRSAFTTGSTTIRTVSFDIMQCVVLLGAIRIYITANLIFPTHPS